MTIAGEANKMQMRLMLQTNKTSAWHMRHGYKGRHNKAASGNVYELSCLSMGPAGACPVQVFRHRAEIRDSNQENSHLPCANSWLSVSEESTSSQPREGEQTHIEKNKEIKWLFTWFLFPLLPAMTKGQAQEEEGGRKQMSFLRLKSMTHSL